MNWVLLSNLSNFLYVFPAARFAESANFSIERIISNACNPNSLGSCVGYKLLSLLNQYSSRSQMMIDKKTWRRFIIMMASYCVALKQLSKRSSSHWPSHAANQILAALSRWWCWDRAYKAWGHIFRPESCAAKCCWCYNVQTICSLLPLVLLAYHVRLNLRIGNRKPYPMVTISVLNFTNGMMMVLYLFHTSPPIYPFLIRGYLHAYDISNESYGKVSVNDLGNLIFREISTYAYLFYTASQ